ncbi:hypothetical protein Hamer_G003805 [Homarus americanus]|uniref:Uncharacterized protein n=1 Tax=Homarus americanus TaxID=6706 RepID=A0A8J5TLV7_HOMAM|nr:hypothetical protein Hamer_G003805 [Homarus americanus]
MTNTQIILTKMLGSWTAKVLMMGVVGVTVCVEASDIDSENECPWNEKLNGKTFTENPLDLLIQSPDGKPNVNVTAVLHLDNGRKKFIALPIRNSKPQTFSLWYANDSTLPGSTSLSNSFSVFSAKLEGHSTYVQDITGYYTFKNFFIQTSGTEVQWRRKSFPSCSGSATVVTNSASVVTEPATEELAEGNNNNLTWVQVLVLVECVTIGVLLVVAVTIKVRKGDGCCCSSGDGEERDDDGEERDDDGEERDGCGEEMDGYGEEIDGYVE